MNDVADMEARYRDRLVRAAAALREAESQVERLKRQQAEPVAVIGMGCRFPGGADDPEAFWRLLSDKVDAVSNRFPDAAAPGSGWGAFLSDVDGFDADFFGISRKEANRLDPQHRILLEVAWEALADAGVVTGSLAGSRTGVFIGMSGNDYLTLSTRAGAMTGHAGTGTAHSFGPGRLSYLLGLRGPNMPVDTACSSSLVSVHLAIRSLRAGESSLALAGGVNLVLDRAMSETVADLRALSPDGRCRTFDARANGFVRGEGCGIVVLKRLSDAQADGDRVLAVLRGSAVNHDGMSAGLTAPNMVAQQELLRQALDDAGLVPSDVGYVETHGTGTALGDPVEVDALVDVFGEPRTDGSSCVLGAVKTNIGHLEAAAGVAGLIKAVLALRHAEIPGNLHFATLNPRISLDGTPLVVAADARAWPRGDTPRIAGVSSFGMSGTNAHVLLSEGPATHPAGEPSRAGPVLVAVSARSPAALVRQAHAYADSVEGGGALVDIAYTAGARRDHYPWRAAVIGDSAREVAARLRAVSGGGTPAAAAPGLTYVFSGQGAQWAGMGRDLLAAEPVFADALTECDTLVAEHAGFSVLAELDVPAEKTRLHDTEIAQPALFCYQIALSALLDSWGIRPDAVLGHSVGEIAAAAVAGALRLDEAARLVAVRGRILARAHGSGTMAAVAIAVADARRALSEVDTQVVVAAVNDTESVVLAGPSGDLHRVLDRLRRRDVRIRMLNVDYAFHAPPVWPLADDFAGALGDVAVNAAGCPIYSTVRGRRVAGPELTTAYWMDNLAQPVRFTDAVAAAVPEGHGVFLEIAPHPVLSGNVACHAGATAVPTVRRNRPESRDLLDAVSTLYTSGFRVDFGTLGLGGKLVSLPGYQWERKSYWLEEAVPEHPAAEPSVDPEPAGPDPSWREELLALSADQRATVVEAAVCGDVAAVLQLESAADVEPDQMLMEIGMDSLMNVQLRHELAARTGWALSSTLAFDYPTPRAITRYLLDKLAEEEN